MCNKIMANGKWRNEYTKADLFRSNVENYDSSISMKVWTNKQTNKQKKKSIKKWYEMSITN